MKERKLTTSPLVPSPPAQKTKSKLFGGIWAPKLHPVPFHCSKASEET